MTAQMALPVARPNDNLMFNRKAFRKPRALLGVVGVVGGVIVIKDENFRHGPAIFLTVQNDKPAAVRHRSGGIKRKVVRNIFWGAAQVLEWWVFGTAFQGIEEIEYLKHIWGFRGLQ